MLLDRLDAPSGKTRSSPAPGMDPLALVQFPAADHRLLTAPVQVTVPEVMVQPVLLPPLCELDAVMVFPEDALE